MLFKKKTALVYITSSNIKVYKSRKLCDEAGFPQDSFKDYLIYDTSSIKDVISSVINKCSLEKVVISIILDESFYFRYDFDKISPNQDDLKKALSYVPLESSDIAYKIVGAGKKALVASSKSICGLFQSIFENMGVEVFGVFPNIVFSDADPSLVDPNNLKSKKAIKLLNDSCNFIVSNTEDAKEVKSPKDYKIRLYILYSFVFLSFGTLLISVWYSLKVKSSINNSKDQQAKYEQVVTEPNPSQNNSSTPTPTPALVIQQEEKSDIKIIVLNATGVPGLAGNTSDNLEDLGYTNIEVGNNENQQQSTSLFYKEGTKKEYLDEIYTYLVSTFDRVDLKASKNILGFEDYDLVIITGNLLTL